MNIEYIVHGGNKHKKIYLTFLVIVKMQPKIKVRYHFILTNWQKLKILIISTVHKDLGKEQSYAYFMRKPINKILL